MNSDQQDSFGGPDRQSFIQEVRNEARRRGPFYAGAAAFALLAALGTVMWASYPRHGGAADPNAVPLIRADAAPYRTKPDDPGGMTIPYRDSTVFNALHGEGAAPAEKVENLLPHPEQPLPREKLIPGYSKEEAKTETPAEAKAEAPPVTAVEPAAAPAAAPAPAPESESKAATPPVENIPLAEAPVQDAKISNDNVMIAPAPAPAKTEAAPAPVTEPAPVAPAPAPVPAPAPAPVKESAPAPAGGYVVQLGSVGSESAAAPTWKKLQASLPALASLTLNVVRADLGAKGIYYRLQAGPFEKQKAKDICAAVTKQKPGGCLVVKH